MGEGRTRATYLDMLLPFIGFLLDKDYCWDAEPDAVREYTREGDPSGTCSSGANRSSTPMMWRD